MYIFTCLCRLLNPDIDPVGFRYTVRRSPHWGVNILSQRPASEESTCWLQAVEDWCGLLVQLKALKVDPIEYTPNKVWCICQINYFYRKGMDKSWFSWIPGLPQDFQYNTYMYIGQEICIFWRSALLLM